MGKVYLLSVLLIVPVILLLNLVFPMKDPVSGSPQTKGNMRSIYEIPVKDIDGQTFKLDRYRGKVMLIVNVASECGYTPQYEGLEKIYKKYQAEGLVILGFPANNFGGQEPGSDSEIKTFCSARYKVTFPVFSKISATGSDIHPLYKYLTEKETNPNFGGRVTWNFNKFLVDKNGKLLARFDSSDKPESPKVTESIEQALKN